MPLVYYKPVLKDVCEQFLAFLQPMQIPGLSRGVNSYCKKSSVFSQLKRVTDRQTDGQTDRRTDGNAISIAERVLRNGR